MTPELLGIVISAAVLLFTILGVSFRLGRRIGNFETRVTNQFGLLKAAQKSLQRQITSLIGLFSTGLSALHRAQILTEEEYTTAFETYSKLATEGIEPFIDLLAKASNPLSPQESYRLRTLIEKARRGEWFTDEEYGEYEDLVRRSQNERPDDPNLWPLIALGAFLLGMYLGKRQRQK